MNCVDFKKDDLVRDGGAICVDNLTKHGGGAATTF